MPAARVPQHGGIGARVIRGAAKSVSLRAAALTGRGLAEPRLRSSVPVASPPPDARRRTAGRTGLTAQYRPAVCIDIACSTRVTSVALVDSRLRASHGMIGTVDGIARASRTSLDRCGNWPWNPLMPMTNGRPLASK